MSHMPPLPLHRATAGFFFNAGPKTQAEKNSTHQKTQGVLSFKTQCIGGFSSQNFQNSDYRRIFQNLNQKKLNQMEDFLPKCQ